MSDEIHGKILPFLAGEFARREGRACVKVELLFNPPGGFRAEELRAWNRSDEPQIFDIEGGGFAHLEDLVRDIVSIAEGHADSFMAGSHRFTIRTHQHLGARATLSFKISPSFSSDEDGQALTASGSGGSGGRGGRDHAAEILTQNNLALMRTNQAMFDGTIRVLGATNKELRDENAGLRDERAELRRQLEEALSLRAEREANTKLAVVKEERTSQGFQKLLQFGTIVAARITGGDLTKPEAAHAAVVMMLAELAKSLRPDQAQALMQILDMPQKALFMEIMQMVEKAADQHAAQAAAQATQGSPTAPGVAAASNGVGH